MFVVESFHQVSIPAFLMSIASSAPSPRFSPALRPGLPLRTLPLISLRRLIPGLLLTGPIE